MIVITWTSHNYLILLDRFTTSFKKSRLKCIIETQWSVEQMPCQFNVSIADLLSKFTESR